MNKTLRIFILVSITVLVVLLAFGGSYTYWSVAPPEKTCASCHEISSSVQSMGNSAHSQISCFECHGTAFSNGLHSLSEKSQMIFWHLKSKPYADDIRMSEAQYLETMERCTKCHQTEYTAWKASGHSAHYAAIFLDEKHNTTEQLNFDCLRCHGMFYEKTIKELVEPIAVKGPWRLKNQSKTHQPTIPCMACHKIHSPGSPVQSPDYIIPNNIFYGRNLKNNSVGFYSRHEKIHFMLSQLPTPIMLNGNDTVKIPVDPVYRLCVQCHAPSVWHQAGNGDDRTPRGVHEGISCTACHERHSNNQRNSCMKCHPAISNCNFDVEAMNTTYANPASPHDIHSVTCKDCHPDFFGKERKELKLKSFKGSTMK